MDFDQLSAIVALAEERNFSRAAHRLFLTQPAVSMKVKALEGELGVALFERTPKDVRPTQAGVVLLERARAMLREAERAREDLRNLAGLATGTLRIACSENISRHYLAPVIARFLKDWPAIEFIIQNMPSPAAESAVFQGLVDLAFTLLPLQHPDLVHKVVLEYRDVGVCSASHPLALRKRVPLVELVAHKLLLLNPATKTHQVLADDFARNGLQPKATLELGSADTQKEFARIGLGVAIIPGYTALDPSKDLHVFQMLGLGTRQIAYCLRQGSTSAALAEFLRYT